MKIKIKKIRLRNFKVYLDKTLDFENSSLIVFDGPNGFGKTTIFDAIELLFTGVIRRYSHLKNRLIDGREIRTENPFYHSEGDGLPILLKVQFEFNGEDYFIARQTKDRENLVTSIDFANFQLYALSSFEDSPSSVNRKDDSYLKEFLGPNYKNDFEFLNYIEQEDSRYLLKVPEQKKRESISYLFNTVEFQKKINVFSSTEVKLKEYRDNFYRKKEELKGEINDIKKASISQEKVEYFKLFPNDNFKWDEEKIDFKNLSYNSILDKEIGILSRIEEFFKNKDAFLKKSYNSKIDRILSDESSLLRIFYYDHFRGNEKKLFWEKKLSEEIEKLVNKLDNFSFQELVNKEYDLSERLQKELISESDFTKTYHNKIQQLKTAYHNSNNASKIYENLLSSRDILKSHLREYHTSIEENGLCSLCGYDWESSELLLLNIEKQKKELETLNKATNLDLVSQKGSFIENEVVKLNELLIDLSLGFSYDKSYFDEDFFDEEKKKIDFEIKQRLNSLKIGHTEYISTNIRIPEDDEQIVQFLDLIDSKKEIYDENSIKSYFIEVYNQYFKNNPERLKELNFSDFQKKKSYVKYIYSLFLNETINLKAKSLEEANSLHLKSIDSLRVVSDILDSLKNTLKWYNAQLINDIELLFHIYSGRIVQNFYGGLGLFIINKNDKIKFVTSPNKTYDAVFSMSNGQLSALIISFTLALNKKYSSNKLLFIDDPIQSMDDMNTAGFVEVLRNEFSDSQIFISTHEENMSTYIRYKFKKFNISSLRIDTRYLTTQ